MMDRNAPDALQDTPEKGYDERRRSSPGGTARPRAFMRISPRFAINLRPEPDGGERALAARSIPDC